MKNKVIRFIRETHMLKPGDRVIVAVSGGADSICLLSILDQLRAVIPVSLRVIHVHHGLRGIEADRDEAWVQEICGRMEIPFFSVHRDVRTYAGEHGMSEEEAGRVLRYEAFEQMAREWDEESCKLHLLENPAKIALAHHQEDQAETILHHLLRGSGLRGLSGMHPVQGRRIRPLLCAGREEIREYLRSQKLFWCEDSTNESGDYTRNRIRRELLPLMESLVNTRAQENLLHAGELFEQADEYLEQQAFVIWKHTGMENAEGEEDAPTGAVAGIALDAFRGEAPIIRSYLIRLLLDHAQPGWKDITRRHFDGLDHLAFGSVGGSADLPGDLRAQTGYHYLWICKTDKNGEREATEKGKSGENKDKSEEISEEKNLEEKKLPTLQMRIFPHEKGAEFPKNLYTKWFDYDKIKSALSVRFREEGDYLSIPGGKRKAITRYMIDEKIPRHLRDQIPLLAEGSHVLWVIGYRISEYYKITDDTKTVLEVMGILDGGE